MKMHTPHTFESADIFTSFETEELSNENLRRSKIEVVRVNKWVAKREAHGSAIDFTGNHKWKRSK